MTYHKAFFDRRSIYERYYLEAAPINDHGNAGDHRLCGNIFDPLSGGFLVPLMLILFFTGISLLCVNGIWITVEKTVRLIKNKNEKKGNKKDD